MSSSDTQSSSRAHSMLAAYTRGGRFPHAILVEGTGDNLPFAKKIAKSLLCPSEKDKPCGSCRDCLKLEKDVHPDLIIYSGGERARSFHIETVRKFRQEAYIKPNEAECKVFILENVQNMTVQAQNALLKIIEEPPANVYFVLTCENKVTLLDTVLSRVSVFSLDIGDTEEPKEDSEEALLLEKAKATLDRLLSGSELEVLADFAPYERDRTGFAAFLAALRSQAAAGMLSGAKEKDSSKSANALRLSKMIAIITIIDEMEAGLAQNVGGLLMTTILPAKFKV